MVMDAKSSHQDEKIVTRAISQQQQQRKSRAQSTKSEEKKQINLSKQFREDSPTKVQLVEHKIETGSRLSIESSSLPVLGYAGNMAEFFAQESPSKPISVYEKAIQQLKMSQKASPPI